MAVTTVQLDPTTLGYEAKPKDTSPQPGVIVIHEVTGMNDYVKEVATLVAERGFIALAVDFFEGQTANGMADGAPLRDKVTDDVFKAKLGAGIKHLKSLGYCTGRVGVTGFCMGGGFSLRAACLFPDEIEACSMFYGRIGDLGLLQQLRAPVVGNFGAEDTGISTWVGQDFWPEMMKLNKTLDAKIYAGCPHGFARIGDPKAYRPEAADDAFERTYALFDKVLRPAAR